MVNSVGLSLTSKKGKISVEYDNVAFEIRRESQVYILCSRVLII